MVSYHMIVGVIHAIYILQHVYHDVLSTSFLRKISLVGVRVILERERDPNIE